MINGHNEVYDNVVDLWQSEDTVIYINESGIATNPDSICCSLIFRKLSERMLRRGTFLTSEANDYPVLVSSVITRAHIT